MSCFRRLVKNIATYLILAYAWLRKIAHRDVILLQGFVTHRGLLDISHANWGDDINKYFFEYVTKKKVVFLPGNDINPRRYICIGSILGMVNLENAIVFGGA